MAEPHEPASTRMIGEVLRKGIGPANRATVIERLGVVQGVVVVSRRCRDRWDATVLAEDPEAAPLAADAVNRSKAWTLSGTVKHVGPLVPHLRRTGDVSTAPFHWMEAPVHHEPDPRVREATAADLGALARLYAGFEQQNIPTRPRLRRFLREALDSVPILVAEIEHEIVAAVRCEWASRTYDYWSAQTVRPDHRRSGLGNNLLFAAMAHSGARGRYSCGVIGASNPTRAMQSDSWAPFMHLQDHHVQNEWMTVRLGPPMRSVAHRLARKALETVEGRTANR